MVLRALGNTGMKVSEVGLGCEHLQGKPFETADAVIGAATDAGVNVMDVFMSEPEVRSNIGRALAGRRDKWILQGHIGAAWLDGQYTRTRDLKQCERFFEDFRTRVGVETVDLGLIHYVDEMDDLDRVLNGDVYAYCLRLKREGAIRAIGMSTHSPEVALAAVSQGALEMMMFSINPAFDMLPPSKGVDNLFSPSTYAEQSGLGIDPMREKLYRACEAKGVGITVMKTLGAGMLLSEKDSPLGAALTCAQLEHYALTRPAVSSVLIGCQTADEVAKAVAYESATDAERDYSEPLSRARGYAAFAHCMYCNHCHPCPSRIDVAAVNRLLDLAEGGDVESAKARYEKLDVHAGDCVACGACEKRCPFGVKVRERMERAKVVFGK